MHAFYHDPSWLVTIGRWCIVFFFLAVGSRNCLKLLFNSKGGFWDMIQVSGRKETIELA